MSVPLTCLADPEWVRVSLAFLTFQDGGVATIDDAFVNGYDSIMHGTFTRRIFTP